MTSRLEQPHGRTLLVFLALAAGPFANESSADVIADASPRVVKIYGAGGIRGLEAYQSGFLISPDGHIVTVWSYVLDTDQITVRLESGRKFEAKLLGADPQLELAVLKIDAADLPHFELSEAATAQPGSRVLAFSNLYGVAAGDEPVSVQHGVISARTNLEARRGVFETPYRGPVYVIDAITNNAGAAGGALVNRRGQLVAMLGKELKNALNNTWLNYAVPIDVLQKTVEEIIAGKFVRRPQENPTAKPERAHDLASLGIVLVPDVLERTPPFIDEVRAGSPAAAAGLETDDLIVLVDGRLVRSCKELVEELAHIERDKKLELTVLRGQELVRVELSAADEKGGDGR